MKQGNYWLDEDSCLAFGSGDDYRTICEYHSEAHVVIETLNRLRAALNYAADYLQGEMLDAEDGRIDIAREPIEYALNKARAALNDAESPAHGAGEE